MNIVHLIDCMEFMRTLPDKHYSLAIIDPPYGININHNMGRRKGDKPSDYKKVDWDSAPPSQEFFDELFRISENQIIWGANYFSMPPTKGFIVWRKPQISEKLSFAMAEYAWTSFNMSAKVWEGMSNEIDRIHPTQKPVALYKWLLTNYAKVGDTIFDSHVGSGSIRIACHDLGFDFEGCEIDPDYWQAQEDRYREHILQPTLFSPVFPTYEQCDIFES